ncbi:hypothetical protein QUS89_22805, partial [Xanthomonas citri pv. citri]
DMGGPGKKGGSMQGMDIGNEDKKKSSKPTMNMQEKKDTPQEMEGMNMADADKKGTTMPGTDMKKKEDAVKKMEGMDMSAKEPSATTDKSDIASMKMDNVKGAGTLTYDMLRSITPTAFDKGLPVRTVPLTLTGNMIRYIWSFDDKPLSRA